MLTVRSILPALAACLVAAGLNAQTYVGNLNGSSASSTFAGFGVNTSLSSAGLGWTVLSGSNVIVFANTNNVVIDIGAEFGSYEVAYNTGVPLVANSTYTLSFTMGYVSGDYIGKASYAFELDTYNGSYNILNSISGGPVSTNGGAFSTSNPSGSLTATVTFTTGASVSSDPIAIKWSSTNAGTTAFVDSNYFGFDNVTLSYVSAIPEPSTYAAIFGGLALGFVVWRRRRSAGVAG